MPTIITKAASSNSYATNEKPVDMLSQMQLNYAGIAPLTAILSRISEMRRAQNVRIDWTEDEELPHRVQHTGVTESSATDPITVASYSALNLGDILFVPRTKERMRVHTAVSDATVDVTRGWGSSTSAVLLAGEWLEILSPGTEEGSEASTPKSVVNTNKYNMIQTVNKFIQTTKDANAESTYFGGAGSKRIANQNKLWRNYREEVEKTLYFGTRAETAGSSLNVRTMGGLTEWLGTGSNVFTVDGLLTETALDQWLVDVWTEMPDASVLTLFAAPQLINIINQIAKPLIRISPNEKVYGMQLNQYKGAVAVDLVPCPLLKGPTLNGWGFLLDMSKISMKYLRPPVLLKDVAMKRYDYFEDKIESAFSMIVAIEKSHGFIEEVTG